MSDDPDHERTCDLCGTEFEEGMMLEQNVTWIPSGDTDGQVAMICLECAGSAEQGVTDRLEDEEE